MQFTTPVIRLFFFNRTEKESYSYVLSQKQATKVLMMFSRDEEVWFVSTETKKKPKILIAKSLNRCAIICIRGTRSRRNYIPDSITENISIVHDDGKIEENYTT